MEVSSEGMRGNRNESKRVFSRSGEGVQQTGVEVNEDKLYTGPYIFGVQY